MSHRIYRSKYRIFDSKENKVIEEGYRFALAQIPKSAIVVDPDRTEYRDGSMDSDTGNQYDDYAVIEIPYGYKAVTTAADGTQMVGPDGLQRIDLPTLYERGLKPGLDDLDL